MMPKKTRTLLDEVIDVAQDWLDIARRANELYKQIDKAMKENRPYFTNIIRYRDWKLRRRWRWVFKAPNGRILCHAHGFNSLQAARENIKTISKEFPGQIRTLTMSEQGVPTTTILNH